MPNSPSTSFIPKQGSAKRSRQTVSRQVHLLTIFSYLLFVSSLVATTAVFFYGRHVDKQKTNAVSELDQAIGSFSDTDMQRVRDFNVRLHQAESRLNKSVSVLSIFKSLEAATVQTVEITDLKLKREGDEQFVLDAQITSDSFDTALFQRGVFERNQIIESVVIDDLAIGDGSSEDSISDGISFTAVIKVPVSDIPYTPQTGVAPEPVEVLNNDLPETIVATTTVDNVSEVIEDDNQTTP